jgi:hypothetical protein
MDVWALNLRVKELQSSYIDSEDGGSMFLINFGIYLQDYRCNTQEEHYMNIHHFENLNTCIQIYTIAARGPSVSNWLPE